METVQRQDQEHHQLQDTFLLELLRKYAKTRSPNLQFCYVIFIRFATTYHSTQEVLLLPDPAALPPESGLLDHVTPPTKITTEVSGVIQFCLKYLGI